LEDINVATDIALCRRCGATSSFASIRTLSDTSALLSKPPPKGVKVERDMMGNGTVITYRPRPLFPLLFLVPFTAGWSGITMYSFYVQQIVRGEFNLGESLVGIPFLLGTIGLVTGILFCLFGKWVIRVNRGKGTVFTGIGKLGRKRAFTYTFNSTVKVLPGEITHDNGKQVLAITIKTDNTVFSFGDSIRDDVKAFIAVTLLRELRH